MKLRTLSIATILVSVAGVAMAGSPGSTMQPVAVSAAGIANCTPPNGSTGHACDAYDRMLRANFSMQEIGLLFGDRSSYPGYLAGNRERLQKRYDAVVQQYLAAHRQVPHGTSVAAAR